jgi:hypothetical protein
MPSSEHPGNYGKVPLDAVYKWNQPGESVVLDSGPIWLAGEELDGKVMMTTDAGLRVKWEIKCADLQNIGNIELKVVRPDIGLQPIIGWVTSTLGAGSFMESQHFGSGDSIVRVVTHWFNLPLVAPAKPLQAGGSTWAGRWNYEVNGWILTLDSRPDHMSVFPIACATPKAVMTHVGELRKVNGSAFESKEVENVLFAFQMAFSFALGQWVAPALPVGFDTHGTRVWEQWADWRCDAAGGYESWVDLHQGNDLRDYARLFVEAWSDPDHHDIVKYFAHHVIAGNHSGTSVEGRIMIVQAGMEYLSWVDNVLSKKLSPKQYKSQYREAHYIVRSLLKAANIPSEVPIELDVLSTVARERHLDGPSSVTWVRNRLVHPKYPAEVYAIDRLVLQAWQLSMHYGDLLLLSRLGYRGKYMRRFPPGRNAHSSVDVPWK